MKESIKFLQPCDYQPMEWKNGKGITSQISIYPPDALFPEDFFLWRLSTAQVNENGSFSKFPGYERYLALIKGYRLRLCFGGQGAKSISLNLGEVCQLSGEDEIHCEIGSEPVTDLNLIFNPQKVKAFFEIIHIFKKPRSFQLEGRTTFIFGISGSFLATVYPGEMQFTVHEGETLQIETPDEETSSKFVLLEPRTPNCHLAMIELTYPPII